MQERWVQQKREGGVACVCFTERGEERQEWRDDFEGEQIRSNSSLLHVLKNRHGFVRSAATLFHQLQEGIVTRVKHTLQRGGCHESKW